LYNDTWGVFFRDPFHLLAWEREHCILCADLFFYSQSRSSVRPLASPMLAPSSSPGTAPTGLGPAQGVILIQ